MSTSTVLQSGEAFDGKFVVLQPLGAGGMGDVYKCRQIGFERLIALKILNRSLADSDSSLQRFEREAKILALLDHKNIAKFFLYGVGSNAVPFIAMEYVEGESLRQRLRALGTLGWKDAVTIAIQVCEALTYAHERAVIHRDLKPENIILTSADRAVVIDFGLAKVVDPDWDSLTRTGELIGTTSYLSPELCRGHRPDHRSDLYSLGIILYEMISGAPPFVADHPMGVIYIHAHETAPNLAITDLSIPAQMNWILAKCIAKDPDARYQSASELSNELRALINHELELIAPPAAVAGHNSGFGKTPLILLSVLAIVASFFVVVGSSRNHRSSSLPEAEHKQSVKKMPASDGQMRAISLESILLQADELKVSHQHVKSQALLRHWIKAMQKSRPLTASELGQTALALSIGQAAAGDFHGAVKTSQAAINALHANPKTEDIQLIRLLTHQLAHGGSVSEFMEKPAGSPSKREQAAAELQQLIAKNVLSEKDLKEATVELVLTKMDYGQWQQALDLIELASREQPAAIGGEYLLHKSHCLFRLGKVEEAKKVARDHGRWSVGGFSLRIAPSKTQREVNEALNTSRCAAAANRYDIALEELEPAIKKHHRLVDPIYGDALLAYAEWTLLKASSGEQTEFQLHETVAQTISVLQDAVTVFRRLELLKLERNALLKIAALYLVLGKDAEASKYIQTALNTRNLESVDDVKAAVSKQLWDDLYIIRSITRGSGLVPLTMLRRAYDISKSISSESYVSIKEQVENSLRAEEALQKQKS